MDPTSDSTKDDSTGASSAGGDTPSNPSLSPPPPHLGMSGQEVEKSAPGTTTRSESAMPALQRALKGKEKEWYPLGRPLRLLDLPVDILREIISQVRCHARCNERNDSS
jgi:hypothetical protein